jgi:ribosomal protein S6--L-glutamate ligase
MVFTGGIRVGILVERRYRAQRQPAGLIAALRLRGNEVRVIDPFDLCEVGADGWLAGLDIVVPRGRSLELLSLVACAERGGVPVINGRRAIGSVHNKLEMSAALIAAGIPTPRTFAAPPERLAAEVPAACYPLVLKPVFGDNGAGLTIVRDAAQLRRLDWPEAMAVAQRLVPGDGLDLKLYGAGDAVWAVRKPSPLTPRTGAREAGPVPVTRDLEALGRRCGELFGLELYGVDCVETDDGPVVIEVNEYPNYTGVEEADASLAAVVERCAWR